MFELVTDEKRLKVLLEIVRNLIVNSRDAEIFRLTEILKENNIAPIETPRAPTKEELKERIKEEVKNRFSKPERRIEKRHLNEKSFNAKPAQRKVAPNQEFNVKRVLRIPKVNLPEHLSYLKPVANKNVSIDLGKLDPYVKDSNVMTIETEGESEPVYVTGTMGRKPTDIKLNRTEIDEVINRFSEAAKIPKKNGIFKVAVGDLLLTAMISESVSPSFVIEKIKINNPSGMVPGPRGNGNIVPRPAMREAAKPTPKPGNQMIPSHQRPAMMSAPRPSRQ